MKLCLKTKEITVCVVLKVLYSSRLHAEVLDRVFCLCVQGLLFTLNKEKYLYFFITNLKVSFNTVGIIFGK